MPRSALIIRFVLITASAGAIFAQRPVSVFTPEQADSGRMIYSQRCASCHGAQFEGSGDAPALTGGTFLLKWRSKMISELFGLILQTMPPTNPGSLGEASALNATAYLPQINGATAGQTALTGGVTTPIGAIASGPTQGVGQVSAVSGRGGRAAIPMVLGAGSTAGQNRGGEGMAHRGVTVAGKVKNLQLKWAWAMNDSGANETTPIVHNGIIYLASPSNIVQALDGRTGDLIWETRVGPDQAPGYGGIRSIAIAEDKVFLPTSDAHMVALDARNGTILWDTPASDKPHVSTSGAIVIGDKVLMGLTGCARFDGEGCYISVFDIHTW